MEGIRIESTVVALRRAEWDMNVYGSSSFMRIVHTAYGRFSRVSIESLNPNSCSILPIVLSCGFPFSDKTSLSSLSVKLRRSANLDMPLNDKSGRTPIFFYR